MDDLTPTDDTSTALTPAVDSAVQPTDAATPGGDEGVAQVAQTALDQASGQTADPIAEALSAIPADDNDLTAIVDAAQRQTITGMRGQLRVLGDAVRELQPLRVYQQYGDPQAVESRLQLAKLLYTPVRGSDGKPVRDPNTQTIRITTKPFVEYIDKASPGLPEQLLVDLLALETENEHNVKEPLVNQVFRFYKLDPQRLPQYQNIDKLIARSSAAVTLEELAEIPSEYHDAYRSIPPSIRAAWASYEKPDQDRMLEDYKGKLDDAKFKEDQRREAEARKAREDAEYAAHVATKQDQYLSTVRRERTAALVQSLTQQVTFSADANTNKVMVGQLVSTMAQLLDPSWRFVAEENVLAPLGLKLDHTFDEALARFEENANESVALELSGNTDRATDARATATSAANQLMARIAIYALKVARAQGATVVERAATQAAQLAAATAVRPGPGNGQVAPTNGRVLPEGMMPGTDEAATWLANSTGLFKPATG